ncbi:MAG: DUF3465 domain-containing protein [Candidatus Velthaea sp.]|jgi:hypothetical protein
MRGLAAGLGLAIIAAGCSPAPTSTTDRCDPAAFRSVQAARAGHAEVTLCGTVVRTGRVRRSRSGVHRVFIVDVGNGDRVQIDANVDIMGDFPIRSGEYAVIRGEYYYDAPGRDGVHWTHRTDRGSHPPGYVTLDGVTYR